MSQDDAKCVTPECSVSVGAKLTFSSKGKLSLGTEVKTAVKTPNRTHIYRRKTRTTLADAKSGQHRGGRRRRRHDALDVIHEEDGDYEGDSHVGTIETWLGNSNQGGGNEVGTSVGGGKDASNARRTSNNASRGTNASKASRGTKTSRGTNAGRTGTETSRRVSGNQGDGEKGRERRERPRPRPGTP